MYRDLERILLTKEQICDKVAALGEQLRADYDGKNPLFVCILKGSSVFFADLIREVKMPLEIDFMAISSYGNGTRTTGEVRMVKDLNNSIEGRHVLVVEDILDSGMTLSYLKKLLESRGAASVKICTLLDKPARRVTDVAADYSGFEIEDYFVVGYGLDYAEKYRNLPEIGVLKPEIYTK